MDVSFLITARNEMFLARTVADIQSKFEADSEIIVIADGGWPDPPLADSPHVHVVYRPQSIGQRAGTNEAARLASGRYVCKIDAHCSVEQGFDRKMFEAGERLGYEVTQIPAMCNLHAFDWECLQCHARTYQGPTPKHCEKCGATGSQSFERKMVWQKNNKRTEYWRFDHELHFQYWGDYKNRPDAKGDVVDVMSAIGACFFMRRDRFFELGGLDETHGSWGQFGTEIACKSWLSGGRHVVNKGTYFVHMFRTQGGDFGFPYPLSGRDVDKARSHSRKLWMENRWPGQVKPLSWMIEKFAPLPGWHDPIGADALAAVMKAGEQFNGRGATVAVPAPESRPEIPRVVPVRSAAATKGLVYYSDCRGDETILRAVRTRLQRVAGDKKIVAVTLDPVDFGFNKVLPLERGYLTMFKQILTGLELLDTDFAYLVEHDVLYHPSHFDFTPDRDDTYYYNQNVWKVDSDSGRALHYLCSQTSGLCANRELLAAHYRIRVAHVAEHGFSRQNGFEPGTRQIRHGGFDDFSAKTWMSEFPNVDIRHGHNLTPSRWRKDQFRNQRYTEGWTEGDGVPGWGVTQGRFYEFLSNAVGNSETL